MSRQESGPDRKSELPIRIASNAALETGYRNQQYLPVNESNSPSDVRRSIGINAKLSTGLDKRTRIDNLGGYHEYQSHPARAKAEETVYKSLNESKKSSASPAVVLTQEPKHSSKMFLADIQGYIPDGPVSIAAIVGVTHLFVKGPRSLCCPARRLVDVPPEILELGGRQLREVFSDIGRRIFYLKQTYSTRLWLVLLFVGLLRQTFEYVLYDKSGKPALMVEGTQYFFGVYCVDGSLLGKMKQSLCDGSYKIYDDRDRVIFTLVGPVFACYAPCVFYCCDEEFGILLSGSADEVGRIGKYWHKDDFPQTHSCFGVSFPVNMSLRSKAIIFGASLAVRHQYYVRGGNGKYLMFMYLLLIFLGFFMYYNCFGACKIH